MAVFSAVTNTISSCCASAQCGIGVAVNQIVNTCICLQVKSLMSEKVSMPRATNQEDPLQKYESMMVEKQVSQLTIHACQLTALQPSQPPYFRTSVLQLLGLKLFLV